MRWAGVKPVSSTANVRTGLDPILENWRNSWRNRRSCSLRYYWHFYPQNGGTLFEYKKDNWPWKNETSFIKESKSPKSPKAPKSEKPKSPISRWKTPTVLDIGKKYMQGGDYHIPIPQNMSKKRTPLYKIKRVLVFPTKSYLFVIQWRSSNLFQVMFANGLIANVFLNTMGDVEKISFDKVIFKYNVYRLIGSLWANIKVITITDWFN